MSDANEAAIRADERARVITEYGMRQEFAVRWHPRGDVEGEFIWDSVASAQRAIETESEPDDEPVIFVRLAATKPSEWLPVTEAAR